MGGHPAMMVLPKHARSIDTATPDAVAANLHSVQRQGISQSPLQPVRVAFSDLLHERKPGGLEAIEQVPLA